MRIIDQSRLCKSSNISYPAILQKIQSNVMSISGNFTNLAIAEAIANAIDSSISPNFLNMLEADLDSASNTTGLSPQMIGDAILQIPAPSDQIILMQQ